MSYSFNFNEIYENLNKEQKNCVEELDGNILVLSGAGTGKTKIIISRFLKHLEQKVDPKKILCVTFSNKAANEINKRLVNYGIETDGLWIGTFHRICFRILQKYSGLPSNVSIIDEDDQKNILDKLFITKYLRDIQLYKDQIQIEETNDFYKAYNLYQEFLFQNNLIDFGEIIAKTVRLLEENHEIREAVNKKFEYIMVDEYQDTSKIQNNLIKLIKNKNLMCVGDDDQSIYSWRGACVDNILNFKDEFDNVKTFKLEQNYRCSKNILSVANHVVKQNVHRLKKELWTENEGDKVTICCTKYEPEFIAREINNINYGENISILVRAS
ncbi:MAG: ATP-dependent helicase, partial [Bacteroidota bacterium]